MTECYLDHNQDMREVDYQRWVESGVHSRGMRFSRGRIESQVLCGTR